MVTVSKMTTVGTETLFEYLGKSGDEKPFSTNGSKFVEMDTGKEYFFDGDEKGWSEQADKYLDSIAIETAPTKTTYYVGDKFDATGMTVKAVYTDESDAMVEDFVVDAPEKIEPSTKIAVKYTENGRTRSADVEISIKSNEATDKASFMEIAQNGSEVVLEDDITITSALTFDRDFVLDLNGYELSTTSSAANMLNVSGGKLTIKGGALKAKKRLGNVTNKGEIVIEDGEFTSTNDLCFTAVGLGSKITINSGKFTAVEGGAGALDGAMLEIKYAEFEISDNFALFTNGTEGRGKNVIIVDDIYINNSITSDGYEACGIYIANDDTFTMNGGTIIANGGCGILMRGGTVTINGGTIKATMGDNVPGWVGDLKTDDGRMSASAVIYHKHDKYKGNVGMNLTINGGTFVGADKAVDIVSEEEHPLVTINNGVFVPPLA